MKKLMIKLLILFVATGLLPWIAYFIGQTSMKVSLWAHIAGVCAVLSMKVWDLIRNRRSKNTQKLDDKEAEAVKEPNSEPTPEA